MLLGDILKNEQNLHNIILYKKMTKDAFTREWIIEQSIDILSNYEPGVLTIRGLKGRNVQIPVAL